jgi:hypothetical protein
MSISAAVVSGGEYLVLVEEEARAKVPMYRWTP